MIQHDARLSARAQDPMDLAYRAGRIRRVMEHAIGIRDVKTLVIERQMFAIRDRELAVVPVERKMMS